MQELTTINLMSRVKWAAVGLMAAVLMTVAAPTHAAASLVKQDFASGTTATSYNAAYSGATTSGNLLVAVVAARGNSVTAIGTPGGWTQIGSTIINGSTPRSAQAIFYKIATGSETTVGASFTGAPVTSAITIYEFAGGTFTLQASNSAIDSGSGGTALNAGSVTTSSANELIFVAYQYTNNGTSTTVSSWTGEAATEIYNFQVDSGSNDSSYSSAYDVSNSAGTHNGNATIPGSTRWSGHIAAFTVVSADMNAPTGLTALVATDKTKESQTLTWGATVDGESNFDFFLICYGEDQTDVNGSTAAGCTGSASAWDSGDDADLDLEATTTTTIEGLDSSTTYWYKIFAVDTFDNAATVTAISSKTKSSGGGGGTEEPAVMVATPNGGETLNPGQSYDIFWAFEGDDVYKTEVSLSTNNGSSYTKIADVISMSGYYTWTVPDYNTSDALIKISLYNESNVLLISDESDATFRINGTMTPPVVAPEEDGDETTVSGMTRIEANGMLPAGITVDALVKMASDNNPNTTDDSTVYYIGMDAKRHPFMSVAAYMSWYTDYSEVQVISSTTLASIPLGSPVLVRPGSHWVKIASDPKTYYVDEQYKLRWIKDEATAVLLGGADWNTKIVDVDPSMFAAFTTGTDLSAEDLSSTGNWPSAALLREAGPTSTTWYVSGGKRRSMDATAFGLNKFQERFVEVGGTAWLTMSTGTTITMMEDGIFSLQH